MSVVLGSAAVLRSGEDGLSKTQHQQGKKTSSVVLLRRIVFAKRIHANISVNGPCESTVSAELQLNGGSTYETAPLRLQTAHTDQAFILLAG